MSRRRLPPRAAQLLVALATPALVAEAFYEGYRGWTCFGVGFDGGCRMAGKMFALVARAWRELAAEAAVAQAMRTRRSG